MRVYILRLLILVLAFLGSSFVFADQGLVGLGDLADSMIAPVGVLSNFITTAAIIIGVGCIFGAILRYSQFRINPLAAPLSSVIILLVLGILLLCLPLINSLMGDKVAFLNQ